MRSMLVRRNEELGASFAAWVTKANRILARDKRALEKKNDQKKMTGEKLNARRRAPHPTV